MNNYDQIIVGAGVIGCSIAYQLTKRGYNVLVLEQNKIGCEASSAAAGMLGAQAEFSEDSPLFRFARDSRSLFPGLATELKDQSDVDIHYMNNGMYKLAFHEKEWQQLEEIARFQVDAGEEAYILGRDEVVKELKNITSHFLTALYLPNDGQVSAPDLTIAFALAARNNGATIKEYTAVTKLLIKDGQVQGVRANQCCYYADQIILATGVGGNHLLPFLTDPYIISPVKGECLSLITEELKVESTIVTNGCYLVPKSKQRIIIGATSMPNDWDKEVRVEGIYQLLTRAQKILPCLKKAKMEGFWSGLRPQSADGFPFLGEVPDIAGLYMANAHFRNGILLSPITGEFMADLIEGKEVKAAYKENFSLHRFQKAFT